MADMLVNKKTILYIQAVDKYYFITNMNFFLRKV